LPLPCARTRHTENTFHLSCAIGKRTTKEYVRRAFTYGARQSIFYKNLFFYFVLFIHYKTIIVYSIIQFYTCLDKFTIFNNYMSLKEFLTYTSTLNCKCIK
jgi:hypothetical protein